MRFFYSDEFELPLPPGHRFPDSKYGLLRHRLLDEGLVRRDLLHLSPIASDIDIRRAHTEEFVAAFENGSLGDDAIRRIGLPWSKALVRRTRATVGGAIKAVKSAIEYGISGQLAGGTHHAHADFGSGYCIYNDQAVAALCAIQSGWIDRAAIIDLDVHQGDGNAAILASEPSAFVFSMHGEKNFPFRKVASDLDVALPDGLEDGPYLEALATHLDAVFSFRPDLVLYQAGVDPLQDDELGRLSLSDGGLKARDDIVLRACKQRGIPVAMAIGGGYADPIEKSVTAYANTYRAAKAIHGF